MIINQVDRLVHYTSTRSSGFWLRLTISAGILMLSVAVPLQASPLQEALIAGLLFAFGAVILFLSAPPLGLVVLIITALIIPSPRLPGGVNIAVLLLGLLVVLWLLDILVHRSSISLSKSRPIRPLLLFMVVTILSFFVGQYHWFVGIPHAPLDAQLGGLTIFLLSAGAFLLTAHQVNDLQSLERMTWVYIALGGLFVSGWLVSELGSITGRIFQVRATANSMFWVWLVALALGQAAFNRRLSGRWRLGLWLIVLATLYVGFFINRDWKSGYLPPIVTVCVILSLRSRRIGLLLAMIAPIGAFYLWQQAIATDAYSYSTRIAAWGIVMEMVKTSPILGFGPANYRWYTPLFPILGWSVQFNSHNQYIDILAQTGLVGLGCFLWFAAELGVLGLRLRKSAPEGFAQGYVNGAIGGLAGTLAAGMLVDWFLPFVYNIGFGGFRGGMLAWVFMGGLVSIERVTISRSPVEERIHNVETGKVPDYWRSP